MCGCLSDEILKHLKVVKYMVTGDVGVPVLLSSPWLPEPGPAPDVTHLPSKRNVYLGLSSLSSCCFFASMK